MHVYIILLQQNKVIILFWNAPLDAQDTNLTEYYFSANKNDKMTWKKKLEEMWNKDELRNVIQ